MTIENRRYSGVSCQKEANPNCFASDTVDTQFVPSTYIVENSDGPTGHFPEIYIYRAVNNLDLFLRVSGA